MASAVPRSGRAGGGGSRWRRRAPTRGGLLTFLVAAMLCSASYCLGMWHNSRGAAGSRVLGPGAAGAATSSCGGDAGEALDFESRHAAESAGLSVSAAAARATGARRALRGRGTRSPVRRPRPLGNR